MHHKFKGGANLNMVTTALLDRLSATITCAASYVPFFIGAIQHKPDYRNWNCLCFFRDRATMQTKDGKAEDEF